MTTTRSTIPLTYGIELEFVFAFREDQLDLTYPGRNPDTIKKGLSYFEREVSPFTHFDTTHLPNHTYNSWGILSEGVGSPQPYDTQPQEILSRYVRLVYPHIAHRVEGKPTYECKTKDRYDRWIICRDATVCGVGQRLSQWLPYTTKDTWDSIGLEAISPVFSTAVDNKNEIKDLVKALHGTGESCTSFITNQCGYHVHVGAAPLSQAAIDELALLM